MPDGLTNKQAAALRNCPPNRRAALRAQFNRQGVPMVEQPARRRAKPARSMLHCQGRPAFRARAPNALSPFNNLSAKHPLGSSGTDTLSTSQIVRYTPPYVSYTRSMIYLEPSGVTGKGFFYMRGETSKTPITGLAGYSSSIASEDLRTAAFGAELRYTGPPMSAKGTIYVAVVPDTTTIAGDMNTSAEYDTIADALKLLPTTQTYTVSEFAQGKFIAAAPYDTTRSSMFQNSYSNDGGTTNTYESTGWNRIVILIEGIDMDTFGFQLSVHHKFETLLRIDNDLAAYSTPHPGPSRPPAFWHNVGRSIAHNSRDAFEDAGEAYAGFQAATYGARAIMSTAADAAPLLLL